MGPIRLPCQRNKTLWLFSDTWVGKVRDGRRVDGTIVNNTVAIQQGKGPNAKVQFFVRRDEQGKAVAFVVPADGHGWFWLQAGKRIGDKLYLFFAQIERTNDPGVFGFRQIGQWLGVVDKPDDDPLGWKIQQHKLPWHDSPPSGRSTLGPACWRRASTFTSTEPMTTVPSTHWSGI